MHQNPLRPPGDPFTIDGHVISPGDLGQKFDFAEMLAARYLRRFNLAADQMPPDLARAMCARADAVVQAGAFNVGGKPFGDGVNDVDMVPLLLWCNLRVTEPGITLRACFRLVEQHGVRAIRLALFRAWDMVIYDPKAEAPGPVTATGAKTDPVGPSTGTRSSPSSAAPAA